MPSPMTTALCKLPEGMNEEQPSGDHDCFRPIANDLMEKVDAIAGDDKAFLGPVGALLGHARLS
jgi:hypothetical protein